MITVMDGMRRVVFEGRRIAHASSDNGVSQRWTDLGLYTTNEGRYVLHRVGMSVVYHEMASRCTKLAVQKYVREIEAQELMGCLTCCPPDIYDRTTPPSTIVLVEQPIHTVVMSEKPGAIIEALYMKDEVTGKIFHTRSAKRLITKACREDEAFKAAWELQHV